MPFSRNIMLNHRQQEKINNNLCLLGEEQRLWCSPRDCMLCVVLKSERGKNCPSGPADPADAFFDALLRRSCHDRFRAHRLADNSRNVFCLTLPRFSHSICPNNSIMYAQYPLKTVSIIMFCSNGTSRNFHTKYLCALRTRNFERPLCRERESSSAYNISLETDFWNFQLSIYRTPSFVKRGLSTRNALGLVSLRKIDSQTRYII